MAARRRTETSGRASRARPRDTASAPGRRTSIRGMSHEPEREPRGDPPRHVHHALPRPRQAAGPVLRRGPGADRPRRGTGLRRVLDRRASHDEVREHRDARDLHRPGAGRDEDASGWGRPRSASSSTIRRTSPAGWRSSTICPRGGSTSASAPAASRPTRSCTASSPRTPPRWSTRRSRPILHLWSSDPPYHFDGKYWKIHLEKTVDDETGIGYIPKPLPEAAPADRRPGHEPQLAEHEDGRAARAPAVRPLPGPRQRAGRHLEDLRGGRPRGRPRSPTGPTGRWPARSSWPTRPRRPGSGPGRTRWANLRVHRPAVRQGTGPEDVQARPRP